MEIPVLDFRAFSQGTSDDEARFCRDLRKALETYGFARLSGHSIPRHTVLELFGWARKFFTLPPEIKAKVAHGPCPNPHRGYSAVGQEKLGNIPKARDDDKGVYDLKESLDLGSESDTLYPNLWVPETDLPGFRDFMGDFYEQCHQMHMQLLEAIALAFSLDRHFLTSLCGGENSSEMRLNHYPAIRAGTLVDGKKTTRISPHTDFGLLTLLFQGGVSGLEIERQEPDRAGCYIPVQADTVGDTIILNVGDCLERWTDGRLPSANHRVTVTPNMRDDGSVAAERYSAAYFGKPNRDASVCSLPEFLTGKAPKARFSNPMTAWEYNQSRLLHTY